MTAETGLTLCVCFFNFSLKMSPSEGPGTSHAQLSHNCKYTGGYVSVTSADTLATSEPQQEEG